MCVLCGKDSMEMEDIRVKVFIYIIIKQYKVKWG